MPGLVDDAGDVALLSLVADDESILPAMLRQPLDGSGTQNPLTENTILMPIPQEALENNPSLVQNPGY